MNRTETSPAGASFDRRRFLRHGAALGASLAALPALAPGLANAQSQPEPPPGTLPPALARRVMSGKKETQEIADYALRVTESDLAPAIRQRLKLNLLDALGCAIGALGSPPIRALRGVIDELGGREQALLIGGGGERTALDRAALYNTALVRYLDFMDNFAAPGEVCHPADSLGALLTVAEHVKASGAELLTAMAVCYQIECRLIEAVPTIRAGLQNSYPKAFAIGATCARLLKLDADHAANAVALAGCDSLALANIQAEPVAQWKGLSTADAAMRAVHNTLLARAGITGPLGVFEGPFGIGELVRHMAPIDWQHQGVEMIERTSIKAVNGEFQSQTAVTTALQLRREQAIDPSTIESVRVDVPLEGFQVIGGGRYGPKDAPRIKEQADHNLKYMIAAALLDGQLEPAQYLPERIVAADVQALLQRVSIEPDVAFSARTPKEWPARVTIVLRDGRSLQKENASYEGFYSRPMPWNAVVAKFRRLTAGFADDDQQADIVNAVADLENVGTVRLMRLLARAPRTSTRR